MAAHREEHPPTGGHYKPTQQPIDPIIKNSMTKQGGKQMSHPSIDIPGCPQETHLPEVPQIMGLNATPRNTPCDRRRYAATPHHKTISACLNTKASELLLNSQGRNHKTDKSLRNSRESMEHVNQHLPGNQFGTKHNRLPKSDKRKCYNCQRPGHIAKNCRKLSEKERQTECYKCHKIGHCRKNCRMNAAPKKVRFAKNA